MAQQIAMRETTVGTQARRLAEDGVLARREERGSTRYGIAEPLFRYWLEYRTGPWEATRVAVATPLLQVLFSSSEIVEQRWASDVEGEIMRIPARRRYRNVFLRLRDEGLQAVDAADDAALERVIRKADRFGQMTAVATYGVLSRVARDSALLSRSVRRTARSPA